MSMQFISEHLLEETIKQLEEENNLKDNKLLYNLCKKELTVIQKLKINGIDMTGTTNEFNERIGKQSIYFMQPQEFEQMEEKARKYDEICKFINSK